MLFKSFPSALNKTTVQCHHQTRSFLTQTEYTPWQQHTSAPVSQSVGKCKTNAGEDDKQVCWGTKHSAMEHKVTKFYPCHKNRTIHRILISLVFWQWRLKNVGEIKTCQCILANTMMNVLERFDISSASHISQVSNPESNANKQTATAQLIPLLWDLLQKPPGDALQRWVSLAGHTHTHKGARHPPWGALVLHCDG